MCAAGSFKLVVQAMITFQQESAVVDAGCRMLKTFLKQTGHTAGKQMAMEAGAAQAVIDGMCLHWKNADLQSHGAEV
jgi:hypothetical protein